MAFWDGWFGNKKPTLNDLSLDDLKREQITVENQQRQLDKEALGLEKEDRQLVSEYAEAGAEAGARSRSQQIVARNIKRVRDKLKGLDTRTAHCQKVLSTINGFITIKENLEWYKRLGLGSALAQMDLSEIESFVNDATVEGRLQEEKFATMLGHVTDGMETLSGAAGVNDMDAFMNELDSEVSSEKPKEQTRSGSQEELAKQHSDELFDGQRELDEKIAQSKSEARRAQTEAVEQQPEAG